MKPKSFMVIAGETSGDMLAAELVQAIRAELNRELIAPTWDYQPLQSSLAPRFFGAGGSHMAAAGVELAFDMTVHSVTGLSDVLKNYGKFRRLFKQLHRLALQRQPDAIICVDFSGFNRRFAHAIRTSTRSRADWFHDWRPRIVQYVSPQVWASRENRAYQMAEDFDLILSIFPFEQAWYAARVPDLRVEFVGHSIVDRYGPPAGAQLIKDARPGSSPNLLLLPGSRPGELKRHVPVLVGALNRIRTELPEIRARMVLPSDTLRDLASNLGIPEWLPVQVGGLTDALREADLALASTGTVTLECAYFGVPAVAFYKTSFFTWQIAKRIVTIKYGAMPNLLADQELFPEFIQDAATEENISRAALELLKSPGRRVEIRRKLAEIVARLGTPGASQRAAHAIVSLLKQSTP